MVGFQCISALNTRYLRANCYTSSSFFIYRIATIGGGPAGALILSSTYQHLHRKGLTSIPSNLQPLERIPARATSPAISTSRLRLY